MQYKVVSQGSDALSDSTVDAMERLYLGHYDGSSSDLFRSDLHRKDEVLLLMSGDELAGFTTLETYDAQWNGGPIRVVYSGDTIVSVRHWGQQALASAWIRRIGEIKAQAPDVPLYWFLLVKGHRTFKYLSTFGKSFHPHWERPRNDLKPLADRLAGDRFGNAYNPDTGVVEFPESRGHLKTEIAFATHEELSKPGVRFFFERNPAYLDGHELVCVCELELHNMRPLTARIFGKALEDARRGA